MKNVGNTDFKELFWNKYFSLTIEKNDTEQLEYRNKIKRQGYAFNYELATDGYSVYR